MALDQSPAGTTTPYPVLLHPHQEYALCVLNKAFCKYFQRNKDGTFNDSRGYQGQFLTDEPELHEMRASLVALTSLLCTTALLGVCGQLLVLWVYWRRLRVGPAGYLIIAVATVDLLVCVLVVPLRIAREWGTKFHSEVGCKMIELIQHQTVMVSLSLLTAIAVERYWCIAKAPKKLFSSRGAKIYIAISIFVSTLLAFPWGVAVTSFFLGSEHRGYCLPTASVISFRTLRNYSLFHCMLLIGLAMLATFCYALTLSFIHTQSEEIKRYAKRNGDWIRKRDKPKYSESESSDTSLSTEDSDAPHIEMQTRNSQELNSPEVEESSEPVEKLSNGHISHALPPTDIATEGESSVQEPDTQPIVQESEPREDPMHGAAASPPPGEHTSDEDSDGYSRVRQREERRRYRASRRRFHRNPWHRLKTRTALTMFTITLLFVICHIPSVLMTYRIIPMVPVLYYFYLMPHTLSWAVYMIMNKHFREQAGKICGQQ